eukprot:scaffold6975_cov83-Skeletonema_menzelii.AAC.15
MMTSIPMVTQTIHSRDRLQNEGLGDLNLNCSEGECVHVKLNDRLNSYCDIEISQLENEEPDHTDISAAADEDDEGEDNSCLLGSFYSVEVHSYVAMERA